jgi:hypothetical protein
MAGRNRNYEVYESQLFIEFPFILLQRFKISWSAKNNIFHLKIHFAVRGCRTTPPPPFPPSSATGMSNFKIVSYLDAHNS